MAAISDSRNAPGSNAATMPGEISQLRSRDCCVRNAASRGVILSRQSSGSSVMKACGDRIASASANGARSKLRIRRTRAAAISQS